MSVIQVERYEKEIKNKGLFSYIKAKNEHFRSQSTAFMYTVASVWPLFGFSLIAEKRPENLLGVMGYFMIGVFPSAFLGALIFTLISFLGKEFIFRLFKNYRNSYNNLAVEKQNFVEMFKDLKNQKIILDFIEWKRKYHMAPVVFHDHRSKSNVDFEKMLVSALANKEYHFAADLFVQFNERIENAELSTQSKILQYREKLETIELKEEMEMEMEMEMPLLPRKINVKEML